MKLRRILTVLIVLTLCVAMASAALAASSKNPDTVFMNNLRKLEVYLRANYDVTNLADSAEVYMLKNIPSMDVERLNKCLARFLGCSPQVSLGTKLATYAANMRSGYKSIYENAVLYRTTPEAAAEKTNYERALVAIEISKRAAKGDPAPSPSCCPCPTAPPCCRY